ncbi:MULTISPECIES: FG-GAP repeat protein [unclassified Microcystis]|uniref:PEP-CTERM sorting domain-containing protein n=2 Tax=Microcystis TaxID=1125 RepID=A0A552KGU6_9CHRO|nr:MULTISPECIES: FG-GAP repeat protein [unclassified Microcystis]MCA2815752.1 FG-GAP repeat protein [Microcystis sp. M085S1]MCA2854734.1 FG-GAP repeat protein [Microcystis sp. M065S1]TRT93171.1 MAG: PEP-CTERM sorting domain-containing protein [Microcystis flos-aquae Ma_QC_C_20070823_S18D]TRV07208.1 MAG: PEP-CTERM sorting domain-containing protein [Microcystis flos-aquae Mf_QC_C_20070823_S10D]TRV28629.1 MAG: PEP-CTERM sorting domain-containing protein [Microcystis flos-aquae Mf_QC_C_20070823_S1
MIKTLVSCLLVVGTTSLAGVIAPAQAFTPLSLTKTFNNPTAEDDDYFGSSVSLSGTSALIGAPYDNTGAPGAGSAYLFDTTTGTLKQTFNNPTPASADNFGYSVSLSGTTALIGAPYDSTGATSAGSAYLFDTTTGNLLKTFNNPTAEDDDYFGYSVSLSGTTALIGAYRDDTGATNAGSAYLFDTTTGNLLKTFNNPTAEDFDNFGLSVSLSGTTALIGAPSDNTGATVAGSAYLFDTTTGNLLKTFNNPTAEDYDYFGYSVSLSGTSALIGAINDNTGATNAGSAYLFETTTGTLKQTFNNPTPADFDNFGHSVSLSGTSALIGAINDDTGAKNAGSAYLFETTTGTLKQTFNNPTPADGDNFGNSVSFSGTSALIGAPNDSTGAPTAGSAYLYQETQTVQVPEPSLTILGTGVVLGVLPFLKKGKKDKEKDV